LSSNADAGEILTRIVWSELSRSGAVELVDIGNVNGALDALRVRATGSPTSNQVRALGDTLGVGFVFVGGVLESTNLHTPDGDVPSIGVALRMVEARTGRVVWTGMQFRTGDDRETIFGWGRVRSAERLAADVASDLLGEFRKVGRETRDRASAAGDHK
jgi:hypothetical protein